MKLTIILCTVLALQFTYSNEIMRYDGYKVYRVDFKEEQAEDLRSIVQNKPDTEFFLFSRGEGIADIFTSPGAEDILLNKLKENKFKFRLLHGDVQAMIDEQSRDPQELN